MDFGLKHVLELPIAEGKLKCFYIGYDLSEYRLDEFTEVLMDAVVDFAFGYHTGILKKYDRRKLKEAAKSIYGIKTFDEVKWTYVDQESEIDDSEDDTPDESPEEKKTKKRGEFGELILHTILRDYFHTVPMLSKIYFKDTDGTTVHGFDSVHIGSDLNDEAKCSLYFGESKIYNRKSGKAGENGIDDLIQDVKNHLKIDFLKRECAIISKKKDSFTDIDDYVDLNTKSEYESFINTKNEWYGFLANVTNGKNKLSDLLSSVTIPLICTYQSSVFLDNKTDSHDTFKVEYEAEVRALHGRFTAKLKPVLDEMKIPASLNVLLILLPIPSKKDLIKTLHQKLYNQQNA